MWCGKLNFQFKKNIPSIGQHKILCQKCVCECVLEKQIQFFINNFIQKITLTKIFFNKKNYLFVQPTLPIDLRAFDHVQQRAA